METVVLDLSRHCILTEIRRQQERAVGRALKGRADEKTLEKAEILKDILEKVDLKSLRGHHGALQGGTGEEVLLCWRGEESWLRFAGKDIPLVRRRDPGEARQWPHD